MTNAELVKLAEGFAEDPNPPKGIPGEFLTGISKAFLRADRDRRKLREALEFYRDGDRIYPWVATVMADGGRKARAALDDTKPDLGEG